MTGWTVAWLLWIGMFFAIEAPAILNKQKGDTLSEHVWKWFAIKNKGNGYRSRRLVLVTFLVWVSIHFVTGGWF